MGEEYTSAQLRGKQWGGDPSLPAPSQAVQTPLEWLEPGAVTHLPPARRNGVGGSCPAETHRDKRLRDWDIKYLM